MRLKYRLTCSEDYATRSTIDCLRESSRHLSRWQNEDSTRFCFRVKHGFLAVSWRARYLSQVVSLMQIIPSRESRRVAETCQRSDCNEINCRCTGCYPTWSEDPSSLVPSHKFIRPPERGQNRCLFHGLETRAPRRRVFDSRNSPRWQMTDGRLVDSFAFLMILQKHCCVNVTSKNGSVLPFGRRWTRTRTRRRERRGGRSFVAISWKIYQSSPPQGDGGGAKAETMARIADDKSISSKTNSTRNEKRRATACYWMSTSVLRSTSVLQQIRNSSTTWCTLSRRDGTALQPDVARNRMVSRKHQVTTAIKNAENARKTNRSYLKSPANTQTMSSSILVS